MRNVYGIGLGVRVPDGSNVVETFEAIVELARDWITTNYRNEWGYDGPLFGADPRVEPMPDHVVVEDSRILESTRLTRITWTHPIPEDASVWRITGLEIASDDGAIEVAVSVDLRMSDLALRPIHLAFSRPRLVDTLLRRYETTYDGWPVPKQVLEVSESNVEWFLRSVLEDERRSLPVVLIGVARGDVDAKLNPALMAKQVRGFAQVAWLTDDRASTRLLEQVGPQLACALGRVQIYWPGFSRDDLKGRHRRFSAQAIQRALDTGGPRANPLLRVFSEIATVRFSEGLVIGRARRAVDQAEARERAERQSQAQKLTTEIERLQVELNAIHDRSLNLTTDRDQKEKEHGEAIARLRADVARLERERDEVAKQRDDIAADRDHQAELARKYKERHSEAKRMLQAKQVQEQHLDNQRADTAMPAQNGATDVSPRQTFQDVEEAVMHAEDDFSDELVFLESAFDSATDSAFKQPDRVYEFFQILSELVKRWREGEGRLGTSWREAISERGFELKDFISKTAENKYGRDYRFFYNRQHRLFEKHITLGAGSPDTCLSIHWYRDDKNRVLVIGHCGRHLTNTMS